MLSGSMQRADRRLIEADCLIPGLLLEGGILMTEVSNMGNAWYFYGSLCAFDLAKVAVKVRTRFHWRGPWPSGVFVKPKLGSTSWHACGALSICLGFGFSEPFFPLPESQVYTRFKGVGKGHGKNSS